MTETTVPRVAKFADLKVGQTVERVYTHPSGTTVTYVGVVSKFTAHHARDDAGLALATPTDDDNPHVTLRILADPTPKLPTTPGTVIRIGDIVWLLDESGDWYCSLSHGPHPEDTADWTVVYDPTAPKADDGLRERLEKLATEWQNDFGLAPSFARELRAALTETSADA